MMFGKKKNITLGDKLREAYGKSSNADLREEAISPLKIEKLRWSATTDEVFIAPQSEDSENQSIDEE